MTRFVTAAGEQVADLAERSAEAGRLSRGRALFRKGSVSDLSIVAGSVTATVRGSKGDLYETSISTALAPPGVRREVAHAAEDRRSVDALIDDGVDVCPREIDLAFACECADWEEPCKHALAALLAFADRVDLDDAELLRWRDLDAPGASGSSVPRSRIEAGPRRSTRPSPERRTAVEVGDRATRRSELEAVLGDTMMRRPKAGDAEAGAARSTPDPVLAEFFGVDTEIVPVDPSGIPAPAPLFAGVSLGPLADLGPALAAASAVVTDVLEEDRRRSRGRQ